MTYKTFYEDLQTRALEEAREYSPNSLVRWSWKVRIRRTITTVSYLIKKYREPPVLLDIGSAGIWLHASLMANGMKHKYVGCDISFAYLLKSDDTSYSNRVVCDASALPFLSDSVDIVASFETIEHLPYPISAATEMKRVANGFIVASVPIEGLSMLGIGSKRFDRNAEAKEIRIRNFIDCVGWDKGLRTLEQRTGAAHINIYTLNRFTQLFVSKKFSRRRVRGVFFYLPFLGSILTHRYLRSIYLALEEVVLSRLHLFVVYLRWLPFRPVGNRYGLIVLYRKKS